MRRNRRWRLVRPRWLRDHVFPKTTYAAKFFVAVGQKRFTIDGGQLSERFQQKSFQVRCHFVMITMGAL